MILYYTGTGNSEYVAKKIGEQIEDEVINLFDKMREYYRKKQSIDKEETHIC